MDQLGKRRRWLSVCFCAFASWSALIPAAGALPSRAALAAQTAHCAVPASGPISLNASTPAVASPIGASPVAATPIAASAAAAAPAVGSANDGEPLNATSAKAIQQLVSTVAACQSKADYKTLAQLVSAQFISHVYGGGLPLSTEQFIDLGQQLPAQTVTIESTGDVRLSPSGAVSADVVWIAGKQRKHARWSFLAKPGNSGDSTGGESGQVNGIWTVDDVTLLSVKTAANAQMLAITVSDKGFSPASLKAKKGSDIVLKGTNADKQDHELLVLRLGKSMTTADLLLAAGPALPKDVSFIGQVTLAAKGAGELVLTGMPRATYVIVDMLPDADGIPFLSEGFAATLTVS